ncbi:cytochrome c [Dyadobacter soli]|uniref:Cytochrome c n=1 Tax=Dyadobacter soli TaxID=659014 RepID=A0A1G8CYR9_9BACT|nr:ThuA domain-containing protein [Dyadobacter soli]SDH50484.1 cytochrome c [Dyadobacter soli]
MKKIIILLLFLNLGSRACLAQSRPRVLIFSKTLRYYHESIPNGIQAIMKLGQSNGFDVDTTKSAEHFNDQNLQKYAAVIWLSTTGDVLNAPQQEAFERYIRSGRGYVGIHSASASEKEWPWFGKLTGAVFTGHPPDPVSGVVQVTNRKDASTKHLPERWKWTDEWYNFNKRVPDVEVLFCADEKTYKGGTEGDYHPLAWKHAFDGGRAFYTALGHLPAAYDDPLFQKHLLGGIQYAIGKPARVLVFTKTKGWHHSSIPFGAKAIQKLAEENNFAADTTSGATFFTEENLKKYAAVIWLNTTGNVLNGEQQAAFERYIQAGGGYVGVHAAADTEYDWPWYGKLMGAHFASHPHNPNVRKAVVNVTDKSHPATASLPDRWEREDEWYNYRSFYSGIKVLAELDENSYEGGTNGAKHPISWYHTFDGGRAFYTGNGHTDESYSDPAFLKHLLGGIQYAMGENVTLDYKKAYAKVTPEQNRFVKTVVANDLNSPMELAIAPDGRVFFTELFGNFSVFDPKTGKSTLIHKFPITNMGGTGLIGVALDPAFAQNHQLYLYYAPAGLTEENLAFQLSRFTLTNENTLDLASEKILLKVPVQKNSGSHHGGSLAWDKEGNLYLSTGDSSTPFPSGGYSPMDERPEPEFYSQDSQRSSGNTNDLKGKILRIHPEADGNYSIPEGNLFPKRTARTLPEIYVMGCRNPYRIAVNPKTSVLYWGEIGPDAGNDGVQGPRGYDEFNQAKTAGNFGWPYFSGNNAAYTKWDFATKTAGPKFDPKAPVNNSPNNTGLSQLPPAQPAMIWYPYAASEEFPELGLGGRSAMAGEFYTFNPNTNNPSKFPDYYDGALFVFDWMRNWVMALRFDEQENYVRSEPFMAANGDFRRPIDLAFSQDGTMYMLEYGSVYGADNDDARLVKIEYNTGNRPPVAQGYIVDSARQAYLDKTVFLTSERKDLPMAKQKSGQPPLRVSFSGKGSKDLDDDDHISFQWLFDGKTVGSTEADASYIYKKPGVYRAVLRVTDKAGLTSTDTMVVSVGNTQPQVRIAGTSNKSFFWDEKPFSYNVNVKDREDIKADPKKIKVTMRYNPQAETQQNLVPENADTLLQEPVPLGKTLMAASDCRACHTVDQPSVGPTFTAIAKRYKEQTGSAEALAAKIINGGGGNWGKEHIMSAHPQLSTQDAQEMVRYIFSITDQKKATTALPVQGHAKLTEHTAGDQKGQYTIVASYRDKGGNPVGSLTGIDVVKLRNANVKPAFADAYKGFSRFRDNLSQGGHKSFILLKNIDMTGIRQFVYEYASAGQRGSIQVRIDSQAGPVISTVAFGPTGSWDTLQKLTGTLERAITGRHDIYFFAMKPDKPNDEILKLTNIRFEQ